MIVRPEKSQDIDAIRRINDLAFGQTQEGRGIDLIRAHDPNAFSMVAEIDGEIVGHIFFNSVEIKGKNQTITGLGLAPMSVHPDYQNQGIGTILIKESLKILQERHVPFVVVLGHADYYPKFGFKRASTFGIRCQWENIPDQVFMAMVLDQTKYLRGTAYYRKEWSDLM